MPNKPKSPCRYPGCPNLCDRGCYCKAHMQFSSDRIRGGASERGYNTAWRKARVQYLRQHPLCAECQKEGRLTPATVVDHIIPHRGNKQFFWDTGNWQGLCKHHHDKKTGSGL